MIKYLKSCEEELQTCKDELANVIEEWRAEKEHFQKELDELYTSMVDIAGDLKAEQANSAVLGQYLSEATEYIAQTDNTQKLRQAELRIKKMVEEKENNKKHLEHHGKEFHNASSRQQHCQLDYIQSKARQALWFVETYDLQITGVSLADKNGKSVECQMKSSTGEKEKKGKFSNLCEEEKLNVGKALFLLDKFCGSDALYHEMAQAVFEIERNWWLPKPKVGGGGGPGVLPGKNFKFKVAKPPEI